MKSSRAVVMLRKYWGCLKAVKKGMNFCTVKKVNVTKNLLVLNKNVKINGICNICDLKFLKKNMVQIALTIDFSALTDDAIAVYQNQRWF